MTGMAKVASSTLCIRQIGVDAWRSGPGALSAGENRTTPDMTDSFDPADADRTMEAEPSGWATVPSLVIVLVEPQLGENIGMVARAMANFGLSDLRLVKPRDGWPSEKARATASRADHVIDAVTLYETTEDAVADLSFVFATTARARDSYKPVREPQTAAAMLRARIGAGQAAGILFGREKYGLSNHELGLADEIVTFPVDPNFASLNIAQAVLLMSYAWTIAGSQPGTEAGSSDLLRFAAPEAPQASKSDLHRLLEHLETSLDRNGYFFPEHKREVLAQNLRTMLTKAGFSEPEVRTLRGVIRSFDYAIANPKSGSTTSGSGQAVLAKEGDRPGTHDDLAAAIPPDGDQNGKGQP